MSLLSVFDISNNTKEKYNVIDVSKLNVKCNKFSFFVSASTLHREWELVNKVVYPPFVSRQQQRKKFKYLEK